MKRILIIEDDETIAAIERDYLVRSGFAVDIAATGDEGLALGRTGKYDLILLDRMLPGLDGFSVCHALRKALDIPILMVTARQEDIDKIRGLDVVICTTAKTDEEAKELLNLIGAPFAR